MMIDSSTDLSLMRPLECDKCEAMIGYHIPYSDLDAILCIQCYIEWRKEHPEVIMDE